MDNAKCIKCGRKAVTKFRYLEPLCGKCYCRMIEKRIRKWARVNKFFSKNDKLLVVGDISRHLVNSMIEGLPVQKKFAKKIPKEIPKQWKLVIPWTVDDEACSFISIVFGREKAKNRRPVKLLNCATDAEISLFCRIKKINYKPLEKDKEVSKFLDKINMRYPEINPSIAKSAENLSKILGKPI